MLRERLGLEAPLLGLFRFVLLALCTRPAERSATVIRSPLLTDDAGGEEDVARCSDTTRAEAWDWAGWL